MIDDWGRSSPPFGGDEDPPFGRIGEDEERRVKREKRIEIDD